MLKQVMRVVNETRFRTQTVIHLQVLGCLSKALELAMSCARKNEKHMVLELSKQ